MMVFSCPLSAANCLLEFNYAPCSRLFASWILPPVSLQLKWPEATWFRFFEFGFTVSKLLCILVRPAFDFPPHSLQPFLIPIGSAVEPAVPLVISEIEIVDIIGSDAAPGITKVAVPTDKIDGIGETIPISSPISRTPLVFLPRCIQRLGIAIG